MSSLPTHFPPDYAKQDKGPAIVIICSISSAIATIFVAARLYVRGKILKRLGLDDYFTVASSISDYLTLAFTITSVVWGEGKHILVLSVKDRERAIVWALVAFGPRVLSYAIPKLAVVALLTKLLNPSRKHKVVLWTMVWICFAVLSGCIVLLYAQCRPLKKLWNPQIKGSCFSWKLNFWYTISAGIVSALVDLYLAIYPAVVLYKLQLNRKKKVGLSIALGFGVVSTIIAIYKNTLVTYLKSIDFTYESASLCIWTSIEGNCMLIAACIPTLRPLFDRFFGKNALDSAAKSSIKRIGISKPMSSHMPLTPITIGKSKWSHRKLSTAENSLAASSDGSFLRQDESDADRRKYSAWERVGAERAAASTELWVLRRERL